MLDYLLLITLLVLSVRAFQALNRESLIFDEFAITNHLKYLVLLYPLGPLALLLGRTRLQPAALIGLVATIYIASIILASRQTEALERTGTDRVNPALAAISIATTGAIVGVVYLSLVSVFAAITYYSFNSGPLGA